MRVKICGITNYEDAFNAISLGADAIGFVFYKPSPRFIDENEISKITKKLPPFVERVGVFVNMSSKQINRACKRCDLSLAQIHFDVGDDFLSKLDYKYIRVVRTKNKKTILKYNKDYILVDSYVDSFGGQGKRVPIEFFDGIDCSRIILAGGIDATNIQEYAKFNFYGVDASSSVECSKGYKDKSKMEIFIKTAKNL